jgi:flagellar M-ring protein FliF
MVDALLNHEALKITQEQVLVAAGNGGEGAVVRSKQSSQSDGRARPVADAGTAARSESSVNEVEFQHGKRIEQIVTAPGAIRRLSVGVVLPDALPPAQAQKLTEVVSMAVGLNPGRGDGIAVYTLESLAGARQESQAGGDKALVEHAAAAQPLAAGHQDTLLSSRDELGYSFALPVALLILAGSLAMFFIRRRPAGVDRLSDTERSRMLRELQEWLAPRAPGSLR